MEIPKIDGQSFRNSSKMKWDFDSVHVGRREIAADTSPAALLSSLQDKNLMMEGICMYIATDEPDTSFFDPLKDKNSTHFLDIFGMRLASGIVK
ncbi:hypothetical protein Hdeb2414_s0001g00019361 [Helianthus debilis subsp. tardiflorus]